MTIKPKAQDEVAAAAVAQCPKMKMVLYTFIYRLEYIEVEFIEKKTKEREWRTCFVSFFALKCKFRRPS